MDRYISGAVALQLFTLETNSRNPRRNTTYIYHGPVSPNIIYHPASRDSGRSYHR